ncbi:MAG: FAD-dependent oxidoreductase [Propionicimonas sp.]
MAPEFDLVVVGAGAAGLLAAVAARRLGQSVLVVESDSLAGGSTPLTDGRLWLPGNPMAAKAGGQDSVEDAEEYLAALLGDPTPASSPERRAAFATTAGRVARWLTSSKIPLNPVRGVADHHLELPGAKAQGRVLQTQSMDRKALGDWEPSLRPGPAAAGGALGRFLPKRRIAATTGEALVGQLLLRATANGVELWLDAPLVDLVSADDRICGVVVHRDGADVSVTAGMVLLASGGFERNQELREEYLPLPTEATWSTSVATNTGGPLMLAVAKGAATADLDTAWWQPVMVVDGVAHRIDGAREKPHSIIVDSVGDRFFDECTIDDAVGPSVYDRGFGVRAVPSFLVMDNRHRQHVALGPWPANNTPRKAIEAEEIVRASTLNDLAQALGIDRAGLLGTVVRFNGFAAKGKDLDFGRGESAVTREGGKRRNPSLGKVDKQPFWAVKVYPGDAGTKGGLLIDADSRVLREDATVIPGLYACGGTAASIFKRTSPAPGAALGEALVQAFLAVTDQLPERRREL